MGPVDPWCVSDGNHGDFQPIGVLGVAYSINSVRVGYAPPTIGTSSPRPVDIFVLLLEQPSGPGTQASLVWRNMQDGTALACAVIGDTASISISYLGSNCTGTGYFYEPYAPASGTACLFSNHLWMAQGPVLPSQAVMYSFDGTTCGTYGAINYFPSVVAVDLGVSVNPPAPLRFKP